MGTRSLNRRRLLRLGLLGIGSIVVATQAACAQTSPGGAGAPSATSTAASAKPTNQTAEGSPTVDAKSARAVATPQSASSGGAAGTPGPSPKVQPFQRPLPLPAVLKPARSDASADYFEVTMREAQVEILPGFKTTIWGYEGQFPGPTIRAKRGRKAFVQQTNRLPEGMSIHLHGGHVSGKDDGLPMDLIAPGASKTYEYPNDQPTATLWYHDHAMNQTATHVYKGLAGLYIVEDDEEARLSLPKGEYEVPLVIQDRLFNADGSLRYALTFHPHDMSGMGGMGGMGGTMGTPGGPSSSTPSPAATPSMGGMHGAHDGSGASPQATPSPGGQTGPVGSTQGMMGAGGDEIFQGDTLLVNGVVQPYLQVASRKYRFRILNGSNASDYELALSTGQPFVQIGTEGGLLPAPVSRPTIYLGAGERVDVVVNFAGQAVGSKVVLQNRLGQGSTAEVMRFDVVRESKEEFDVPQKLRDLEALDPSQAVRTLDIALSQAEDGNWLMNGQAYDEKRVDVKAKRGEVEIWRFLNQSMMAHPMHIHQTHWQILDRNGQQPPEWERGWKDTFVVQPMEVVRVIGRWSDYTGSYVQHCHILEHEDRGMMQNFEVG